MATLNIVRDNPDPFYRYKMEKLISKIEGKGNGIKTVVANLSNVAQQLSRPPIYVVKFFGFELGAQTNTGADDRWIINGAHEANKLQDYLDGFINKFVLCKECKNPETVLEITKDEKIIRDCKACGRQTTVEPSHKLSGYIIKNPPASSSSKKDKKGKGSSGKKGSRKDKHDKNERNGSPNGNEDAEEDMALEAGSDDEFTNQIQIAAKDLPTKSINKESWTIDTSEEAAKKRMAQVENAMKHVLVGDEDEEDEGGSSAYDQIGTYVTELKQKGAIDDVDVYAKAQELGIEQKHKTLQVLAQTMFGDNMDKEIPKHAGFLKKLVSSERHARALLGGTERFVGGWDAEVLNKKMPAILMAYYENDIVTEEVLIKWGSKASKKYTDLATSKKVRKASHPFIEWLETADAESDEDDE